MANIRLLLLVVCFGSFASAADAGGKWELTLTGGQIQSSQRLNLELKDGKYTGNFQGMDLTGSVTGNNIVFDCVERGKACGSMKGTITDAGMSGEGTIDGLAMTWTARRPAMRGGPATRHEFKPKVYYREFSGDKPAALHVFPGDTIHTTTVDAGGRDADLVRRVFGGNPLTGPFYVEGAMPGDTLVVKFTRIRLNRDSAFSGDRVVGTAVDPYFFRDQAKVENFDSEWKLDRENSIGQLKNATERLKNYKVPLRPMLGCVGVAPPARQSFRAGNLGDWGGNMDYNQLREGTTVFLPVYQAGALLFVGDGHAAQGDGELTGDALETSMDVEFTVDLQPGINVRQPRMENDEYVMTSGVANSFHEAVQKATTAMSRYLANRYKLNPAETGIVLGTAIKYDIAELVDPQIHVVAKLPWKALEGLKAE
jgi:acetamidase/formamidase